MAAGFNSGVLCLLGVVIFVLGCCVGFVVFLIRRAVTAAPATPEELEAARAEFSVGFTPMVERASAVNRLDAPHPDSAIAPGRNRRLLRRAFRAGDDQGASTQRATPAGAQHSSRRKGHSSNRF